MLVLIVIGMYRFRQLGAARENSQQFNRSGALYPWTAGRFGNCTGVGPYVSSFVVFF